MNVLLFGATGSAGGSVLKACLDSPLTSEVRIIGRRAPRHTGAKLRSYLHHDFLDYRLVRDAFREVDVCFFCLGISVTAVPGEAEYRRITHDYAIAAARMLCRESPLAVFHYLSAQGAHRSSPFMWCRVKAETDDDLLESVHAVCWRPGAIEAELSDHAPPAYRRFHRFFRLLKPFRSLYVSGDDLARAMLQAASNGMIGRIVSNREIRSMAACG